MLAKNCPLEIFASECKRRSSENAKNASGNQVALSERQLIDIDNKTAENLAKEKNLWVEFSAVLSLGVPAPSGVENMGFVSCGRASFSNGYIEVSDLHPRNVLKDCDGDLYVVDAEFKTI